MLLNFYFDQYNSMVASKTGPNLLVVAAYVVPADWIKLTEMNHKKNQNKLSLQVHQL